MKNDKINQILTARAQSPTPVLQPDPFLPTRVRALVNTGKNILFPGWRISAIIGALALLIGIYIGNDVDNSMIKQSGDQSFTSTYDLSGALYQESLSDDFNSIIATLDKGEKQ